MSTMSWPKRASPSISLEQNWSELALALYGRADVWSLCCPDFLYNNLIESLLVLMMFVCHNVYVPKHWSKFDHTKAALLYHLIKGVFSSLLCPCFCISFSYFGLLRTTQVFSLGCLCLHRSYVVYFFLCDWRMLKKICFYYFFVSFCLACNDVYIVTMY